MSENTTNEAKEGIKLYELAFNIIPDIGEENAKTEAEDLKKIIENQEGNIIGVSDPALINLAYTMVKKVNSKKHKYNTAYFGWIKFEVAVSSLDKIKSDIDGKENILRYMIIKTVKETNIEASAIAQSVAPEEKEEPRKRTGYKKKEKVKEEKTQESVEEVDKAIDDLVAENN